MPVQSTHTTAVTARSQQRARTHGHGARRSRSCAERGTFEGSPGSGVRGRLPAARRVRRDLPQGGLTLQHGRRSCQRVHDDSQIALPALPDWLVSFEAARNVLSTSVRGAQRLAQTKIVMSRSGRAPHGDIRIEDAPALRYGVAEVASRGAVDAQMTSAPYFLQRRTAHAAEYRPGWSK